MECGGWGRRRRNEPFHSYVYVVSIFIDRAGKRRNWSELINSMDIPNRKTFCRASDRTEERK